MSLLAAPGAVTVAQDSDIYIDAVSGTAVYGDPADRFTLPLVGEWRAAETDTPGTRLVLNDPAVELHVLSLGPDEPAGAEDVLERLGIDTETLTLIEENEDPREFPGWQVHLYLREDGRAVGVLSRGLEDGAVTLVGIGDPASILSAETVLTVRRFSELPVAAYLTQAEVRRAATPGSVDAIEDLDNVEFYSGDTKLTGRLRLPEGEGPFPAVVGTHGSGRGSRWAGEYVPVSHLVDAGFAVFNYDKRGVDDSDGQFTEVGVDTAGWRLPELADDALAAAAFVRGLEEIDPSSVGLMGGSQAGWVNPLAASRSDDLAFIVSVVGPTVTVGEEIYYSDLTGGGPRLPSDFSEEQRESLDEKLEAYDGPVGYDPRPAIETMTTPGLWVLGGRDASIPTPQTQAILDEISAERPGMIDVIVHEETGHDIAHHLYQDEVVEWLSSQLEMTPTD